MNLYCKNPTCKKPIQIAIFKGEDFCCVKCRKALGLDARSQGNLVLLSAEEEKVVKDARRS